MKMRSVSLFTVCLCFLLCGCRKEKNIHPGSLKGRVVYTSCATTVIRITNQQMGVTWTNCHDGQRYDHVFDAQLLDSGRVLKTGDAIYFDIVPDEPFGRCKMIDCVPSMTASIRLR